LAAAVREGDVAPAAANLTALLAPLPATLAALAPPAAISEALALQFRNPPNEYRLVQYQLDSHTLDRYPRHGIGGFMAFFYGNLYQHKGGGVEQIGPLVAAAAQRGMPVWLADDFGYPSGMAGGRVVEENPAFEVRGLAMRTRDGSGGGLAVLELPAGAERFVSAVLYPLVDGRPELAGGRVVPVTRHRVEATGVEGPWRLCGFVTVIRDRDTQAQSTMQQFGHTGHAADLLNPDAVASFMARMHAPIAAQIKDLPAHVAGFYANEPNLMQLHWKPTTAPFACMPWTDRLPACFERMHGYDLMPRLAALFGGEDTEARRVRMHFQQAVAELLAASYARPLRAWCNALGVQSSGHFLLTEHLSMQVANYGDYLKVLSEFDVPAMETGIPNPDQIPTFRDQMSPFVRAAVAWRGSDTSMCLLDPIIQGGGLQRLSPATPLLRNAANQAFLNGINTFSSYMPLEARPDGSAAGYTAEDYRALNEYIGRVCVLLRGARPATAVALYYPIAMFQADYRPSDQHWPRLLPLHQPRQQAWDDTEAALRAADVDFTIVHPEAVAQASVDRGIMGIGSGRYRYLVLPQVEFLPRVVLGQIKAFEAGGGTVLWVGRRPRLGTYGRDDAEVAAALEEAEVVRPADLSARITNPYAPDFSLRFEPAPGRLAVVRFLRGEQAVYLLVNRVGQPIRVRVSAQAGDNVDVFDPSRGSITQAAGPAALEIAGFSCLLVLRDNPPHENCSASPL
jgi:hypothetical protein